MGNDLEFDVVIVGGGAAGLAAGIFAAQTASSAKRIAILDTAKSLGAKILVSGGGRCNVTHEQVVAGDFNGSQNIVRNILAAFDAAATVRWFESLGVKLKREETGKLFPVADSARVIVRALVERFTELGGIILCGKRVTSVEVPSDGTEAFLVRSEDGVVACKSLILATGGRSLPRSGSDGSGWAIAEQLGHTVTRTYAALAPLVLDGGMFHAQLAGISMPVRLTTFIKGKRADERTGSLLWTHFGISGPVVMDASRFWIGAAEAGEKPEMRCNLLPTETFESIDQWLTGLTASRPKLTVGNAIPQRLPQRVAEAVLAKAQIDGALTCGQLSRDGRRALAHVITNLHLPVTAHRGWNYAEVTAGGVPLNEINFRTMESRKLPHLYLAGEILDCDGRIGGFNFQWAWATGYLAGIAAAKNIEAK
jgi:predicted Rossmann fold flavoprotein